MRAMRSVAVMLFATVCLAVAAGCGGTSTAGGVGTGASPAAELKPGALVYWESVTDPGSDEWQQAEELLQRFPDGEKWIAELRKSIANEGVDWEQDVEPALGETTALAVYPKAGDHSPDVVGLTNPEDPDKTTALVAKLNESDGGDPKVTRVVGDWVLLAESETAIDAALKTDGGGSLADDGSFTSAMEELPDDSLSRVYVDPAGALEAFAGADASAASAFRMLGLDRLDFAGAWAKAKEDGAELAFTAGGEGAAQLLGSAEPYSSALLDRVPADAFAFVTFQGRGAMKQLEGLENNPLYAMGLRQLERELGVKIEELVALAEGEIGFYARTALPFPELTLMLDSDNPEQARASAENVLRGLARQEGGAVTEDGGVTTAVIDEFTVSLGTVEDLVVFTTSKDAFDELAGSGDKLPGSDRWRSAVETAGVPDEYTSLTYVDVGEALALLQAYLGVSGKEQLPPEVARNLEALTTFVAWGTLDGEVASARAFLEID
jgi:Protein of unknown function (DUF3352)